MQVDQTSHYLKEPCSHYINQAERAITTFKSNFDKAYYSGSNFAESNHLLVDQRTTGILDVVDLAGSENTTQSHSLKIWREGTMLALKENCSSSQSPIRLLAQPVYNICGKLRTFNRYKEDIYDNGAGNVVKTSLTYVDSTYDGNQSAIQIIFIVDERRGNPAIADFISNTAYAKLHTIGASQICTSFEKPQVNAFDCNTFQKVLCQIEHLLQKILRTPFTSVTKILQERRPAANGQVAGTSTQLSTQTKVKAMLRIKGNKK